MNGIRERFIPTKTEGIYILDLRQKRDYRQMGFDFKPNYGKSR